MDTRLLSILYVSSNIGAVRPMVDCGGGVWWQSVAVDCGGGVWRWSVAVECGGGV